VEVIQRRDGEREGEEGRRQEQHARRRVRCQGIVSWEREKRQRQTSGVAHGAIEYILKKCEFCLTLSGLNILSYSEFSSYKLRRCYPPVYLPP
jgi:hypothetical protein